MEILMPIEEDRTYSAMHGEETTEIVGHRGALHDLCIKTVFSLR